MIYNVLVSSEPAPNGEFEYEVTVELLGDDNPEFDIPNGPHTLKLTGPASDEETLGRIDAKVREWLRKEFGIES